MAAEEPIRPPPRARPESTIAQTFAADLDSMFGLGEVDELSKTIEQKKSTVTTGQQQLQELEARLRETEQRLAKVSRQSSPARPTDPALSKPHSEDIPTAGAAISSPLTQRPLYPDDRPPTGDRPPSKRADPSPRVSSLQTPQQFNGSNEYVMVDRNGGQAQRGYG
ncbi:uncharacterized protein SEPMUDRAFT_146511 [Sphaerulina musiva SO2202]|uniref:Uncharacterized protein n=1 Tax=Sphaerulina musiva (strain SO2202) TaxID=692275 RepID=N1QMF1_SPHMS|nr:uncharacterized protein SEPMUDRAFT_146511 [Sphaerulina musiva SO2202]EMF17512.1 hypothetical protein SEPMUDRAFT_146511 [Sphaerulina musiva SO2202]